jgi:hypothetical protein
MTAGQSSPEPTTVGHLRRVAAVQGVDVSDRDLEAVRGFLDAILPELARLEAELAVDDAS